jgi:hypothetical protein
MMDRRIGSTRLFGARIASLADWVAWRLPNHWLPALYQHFRENAEGPDRPATLGHGRTGENHAMKHMFTGLMAAVATVLAGPAGAAPLEKSRVSFSGNHATAYYSSYDEAGVYRSWQVDAFNNFNKQGNVSAELCVGLYSYFFDEDIGDYIYPYDMYGCKQYDSLDLVVGRKASSATLVAQIEVTNYTTNSPVVLQIDLSWAPTEPASSSHSLFHTRSRDYMYSMRTKGQEAAAYATGTISDENLNYVPAPPYYGYAYISQSTNGELTVVKH